MCKFLAGYLLLLDNLFIVTFVMLPSFEGILDFNQQVGLTLNKQVWPSFVRTFGTKVPSSLRNVPNFHPSFISYEGTNEGMDVYLRIWDWESLSVTLSPTFYPGFFVISSDLFVFWLVESLIIFKSHRLIHRTVGECYFISDWQLCATPFRSCDDGCSAGRPCRCA